MFGDFSCLCEPTAGKFKCCVSFFCVGTSHCVIELLYQQTKFETIEFRRIVGWHFQRDYVLWTTQKFKTTRKPENSHRTFNGYKLSDCACQEMLHLACKTRLVI